MGFLKPKQQQKVEIEVEVNAQSILDAVLQETTAKPVAETPELTGKVTQVTEVKRQKAAGSGWMTVEVLKVEAIDGMITLPAPKEGERYAVFHGPKPKSAVKPCGCHKVKK